MELLKKFIALMPSSLQEKLKQYHFRRQIKNGTFVTLEPEFYELDKFISSGNWVIDIGANIGHYTNKFSEIVGKEGRVIAFEPIPVTFNHLSNNTQYCKYKNITLINAAVSTETTSINMSIPDFSSGLKNYYQASISSAQGSDAISVLTVSLDQLQIKNRISLIKIDAEGHEPEVISGALKILERDKPVLIVETVTEEIRKHLLKIGYTEEIYENSPNIVFTC